MQQNVVAESLALVAQIRDFFRQQQELYGDDIFLDFNPQELGLSSSEKKRIKLLSLYFQVKECHHCQLAKTRKQLVFGSGDSTSPILLIGEAPGATEDEQGRPFVGEAGKLLDKILAAIKLTRSEVFVTNVVKCRPPANRDPQPEEITACASILKQQVDILQPKFILILGRIAAQSLLKTTQPLRELRGQAVDLFEAKAVVTYHPAALLREPGLKRSTWEDVQLFQQLFKESSVISNGRREGNKKN